MNLDMQIFYNDVTSDMETETSESTLSCNLYVNAAGASPAQKKQIKELLDRYYAEISADLKKIQR